MPGCRGLEHGADGEGRWSVTDGLHARTDPGPGLGHPRPHRARQGHCAGMDFPRRVAFSFSGPVLCSLPPPGRPPGPLSVSRLLLFGTKLPCPLFSDSSLRSEGTTARRARG